MARWRAVRWEMALNIDVDDVTWNGVGNWSVESSNGDDAYVVKRLLFHCPQQACIDRLVSPEREGQLCGHRYSCDCPDCKDNGHNPCKHIYRVWTLDTDPYPPRQALSEASEKRAMLRNEVRQLVQRLDRQLAFHPLNVYAAADLQLHLHEVAHAAGLQVRAPPRHYESDSSGDEDDAAGGDGGNQEDDDEGSDVDIDANIEAQLSHSCKRRTLSTDLPGGAEELAEARSRAAREPALRVGRRLGGGRWTVGEHTVRLRRVRCNRRGCVWGLRGLPGLPCRHLYECSCCPERPRFAVPCTHVFHVAAVEEDPGPPHPQQVEQEADARRMECRFMLTEMLNALAQPACPLRPLKLPLWRALRYAHTAVSVANGVADDAALQEFAVPGETGEEHRCPGSWVVLSRRQVAQLIPAQQVRPEAAAADGRWQWRVQGRHRVSHLLAACLRPGCVARPDGCLHLYQCSCDAPAPPCCHVLRVHGLFGPPPRPAGVAVRQ